MGRHWSGMAIQFVCDNLSVVQALSSGRVRDAHLLHLLQCLFFLEAHFGSVAGDLTVTTSGSTAVSDKRVQHYFTAGLAKGTRRSYLLAQRRYSDFCAHQGFTPLPLSENKACLYVAYLADQGLLAQSIASYLSALRFWQIAVGLGSPPISQWPRLHYTVRGAKRLHPKSSRLVRLPITPDILLKIGQLWSSGRVEPPYMARLLWAGCCIGFLVSSELVSLHQ